MNIKDLQAIPLVGPTRENLILDPLTVQHLDNLLFINVLYHCLPNQCHSRGPRMFVCEAVSETGTFDNVVKRHPKSRHHDNDPTTPEHSGYFSRICAQINCF